jgi:hypothetical protein
VEKVGSAPKYLRFMVALESETLPHVQMTEPRLEGRERGPLFGGDFR